VIALDTNLLVHAHRRDASLHDRARQVVRDLAESGQLWGICFHSMVEFHAVVTHPRIWRQASTPEEAMDQIAAWRESPGLRLLLDTESGLEELARWVVREQIRGGLIHDARIAVCCLDHGVRELWTVDRDFSRFPDLKVRNPLVTAG